MLTGATGFIGSPLLEILSSNPGYEPKVALRSKPCSPVNYSYDVVGDLDEKNDWRVALNDVQTVVHCAARVHIMRDKSRNPLEEFRRSNVLGTLNLARQAAESGVMRFVFLSSIKVNGEQTPLGQPFTADDLPLPKDPYGISKHEAEQGLLVLAEETGMEVVIIRPPLVYGPGVKGNFLSMMKWLHKGIPLPLGAIHNRRSLVARDNLVDLIVACLAHPRAANQVFLVSDGEDLSTTDLLRRLASGLGVSPRLLPVPPKILELGAGMLGKGHIAQRLCGNLQVDITNTREFLGWKPPVTVDQSLQETAKAYLATREH